MLNKIHAFAQHPDNENFVNAIKLVENNMGFIAVEF